MTQFLTAPVQFSIDPADCDSWVVFDLSSYVPKGATGAIFQVVNTADTNWFALVGNDSTDTMAYELLYSCGCFFISGLDSNRKCKAYVPCAYNSPDMNILFYLRGYLENDATIFTNIDDPAYDVTPAVTECFCEVDLSSWLPEGAVAAIIELATNLGLYGHFGYREKGSSDYIYGDAFSCSFIVPVDSDRKCELWCDDDSYMTIRGYLTEGYFFTEKLWRTPDTTDVFIEHDESSLAPANASGVNLFFECWSPGDWKKTVRKKESVFDIYSKSLSTSAFCGLDANKKWEIRIDSAYRTKIWLDGYFVSSALGNEFTSSFIFD